MSQITAGILRNRLSCFCFLSFTLVLLD